MKLSKSSQANVEQFMENRMAVDAIGKALSRAKSYGFTNAERQPLIIQKLKIANAYKESKERILTDFVNCNVMELTENWYAILCLNGSKKDILVCPLNKKNLADIQHDFITGKLKPQSEYGQFIKQNTNHKALDQYKIDTFKVADKIMEEFLDCICTITRNKQEYSLTSHCLRRWNERVYENDEKLNKDTRKNAVGDLAKSFAESQLVYENSDGRFFFNKEDVIFFVVSQDNSVVTLWKSKFGFSCEDIDRVTTLMQLDYINQIQKEFYAYKEECDKEVERLKEEENSYINSVHYLEEQIESLINLKNKIQAKREQLGQHISEVKNSITGKYKILKKEESLLFKPHKMVTDVNEEED
jgi:hypothetical protein